MRSNRIPWLPASAALLLTLLVTAAASAQPSSPDEYPMPLGLSQEKPPGAKLSPLSAIAATYLPPLDARQLLTDDEARLAAGEPLRYALLQTAAVDARLGRPAAGGTWESLPDGGWLWRLRIRAEGAKGLGPVFDRFHLSGGALLHLYAADGSHRIRPFTAADNKAHGELWAPSVRSDDMVVELFVPTWGARDATELRLAQVGHAYRDVWTPGADKSGACNIDVACPEGDAWRDEIRAVGAISIGNTRICTGFLVNNTAENDRALFMSANHCQINAGNDQSLRVNWNYENTTCRTGPDSGNPGDGPFDQFQIGANFLVSDFESDVSLVELLDSPGPFNPYFLGWDGRDVTPTSSVTIHHPQVEEKRISFENDPVERSSYLGFTSPGDASHLRVNDWDLGTTEQGSSGAPLLDAATRRVVGQLHGGAAACSNDLPDWYGRTRLALQNGVRPFLDPTGSGVQFLDGKDFGDGSPVCVNDTTTLCLNKGRFEVKVDWRDFAGNQGPGRRVVDARTDDSGLFWFFGPQNWEVLVKVLDACADPYNRYWVFFAATTNVEYTLTVTDTETGESKTYSNPLGSLAQAVTDTDAFATCP